MIGSVRRAAAAIGAMLACFVGFWWTPHPLGITDLDEGLYAAAAREMALTGDWVTPRVNGTPFYEKPPLLYWLSAGCIRAFGRVEWAVRLPSAIAATLTLLVVYRFGRRRVGPTASLLAVCALALAPLTVASARLATTDATLVFLVACSLFAAYRSRELSGRPSLRWSLVAFAMAALASLAKGAAGCVTVLAVLAAHDLVVRRVGLGRLLRSAMSVRAVLGLAFFIGIVAPWHAAAWRANGQAFVDEYVVRQHIGRFRGGDTAHHAPVWFYVPGFLLGFFPWSVFSVAGLVGRQEARGERQEGDTEQACAQDDGGQTLGFLRCWFAVVFLMFSLGGSKLVSYILPMYPAAALLAGRWLVQACSTRRSERMVALGATAALVCMGLVFAALVRPAPVVALINRYADRPVTLDRIATDILALAAYLAGAICLGLVASLVAVALRRARWVPAVLVATMGLFYIGALTRGVPIAQERMVGSLHALAAQAGRLAGRTDGVVIAVRGPRRPSVLYYLPDEPVASRRVIELDPKEDGAGLIGRALFAGKPPSMRAAFILTDAQDAQTAIAPAAKRNDIVRLIRRAGRYSLIRVESG